MTFEEFENTLQDWLDEGRLDEVATLIPKVCESDRAQCEELLLTYQALFAGLASSAPFAYSPTLPELTEPSPLQESAWKVVSLPGLALALALCLTIFALVPGFLPSGMPTTDVPVGDNLVTVPTEAELLPFAPELGVAPTRLASRERDFTRFAASSFEPLAIGMATRTDSAFKSLNQVASHLNPIDDQLDAYRDAAPLIDTLTRGFLPGTHSLSNAFSILQESTIAPPVGSVDSAPEATPKASPETATVG